MVGSTVRGPKPGEVVPPEVITTPGGARYARGAVRVNVEYGAISEHSTSYGRRTLTARRSSMGAGTQVAVTAASLAVDREPVVSYRVEIASARVQFPPKIDDDGAYATLITQALVLVSAGLKETLAFAKTSPHTNIEPEDGLPEAVGVAGPEAAHHMYARQNFARGQSGFTGGGSGSIAYSAQYRGGINGTPYHEAAVAWHAYQPDSVGNTRLEIDANPLDGDNKLYVPSYAARIVVSSEVLQFPVGTGEMTTHEAWFAHAASMAVQGLTEVAAPVEG
ncbi:MAG TPA: hypothetical protein VMB52_05310 [Verrucomicrobiae bacterium]|nr:hypothetical protein [Verrucomicrobiae bacterium]